MHNEVNEVCLGSYELFVNKTVPKFGYLADFFATSLPTTHAYAYALLL